MNKWIIFWIFIACIPQKIFSQNSIFNTAIGKNAAIGGDAQTALYNPANFRENKNFAGLSYSANYLGSALSVKTLGACVAGQKKCWGGLLQTSGTAYLNYWKTELTSGMQLNPIVAVGVGLGAVLSKRYDAYADALDVSGKIALRCNFLPNWNWNVVLENPWQKSNTFIWLQSKIQSAVEYQYQKNTTLFLHYRNTQINNNIAGVGIKYNWKKYVLFAGVQNGLEPVGAGLEMIKKKLNLGFAFNYHVYLGITSTAQIVIYL